MDINYYYVVDGKQHAISNYHFDSYRVSFKQVLLVQW